MKRSFLLSQLKSFLEQERYTSCFELTIFSGTEFLEKNIFKNRSIFIVGLPEAGRLQLDELLQGIGFQVHEYGVDYYPSLDDLVKSTRFLQDDVRIDFNWRGRVLKFQYDFNFGINADQFESIFLKSYFRLIISKFKEDYYTKHDITPLLWRSATSVAGRSDFRDGIQSFVKFINKVPSEYGMIDPDFDFVKVFISKETEKYRSVDFLGTQEMLLRNFNQMVLDQGEATFTENLYNDIRLNF